MVGSDGMPLRTIPDAPGDVVKDGLRLRAKQAGDILVGGVIGDRGESRATAAWVPGSTKVSLVGECYLETGTPRPQQLELRVRVQGLEGYFGSSCLDRPTTRDLPSRGFTPGEPGQGWTELTVGRRATLVVEVVDRSTGKPTDVPGVQVAGAVYERGFETPIQDASGKVVAVVPDVLEHQGYAYSQVRMSAAPLKGWQDLTTGVDPGPAMVAWGSAGDGLPRTGAPDGSGMRLTRFPGGSEARGFGTWGTTVLPADSTLRVTVSASGTRPDHGSGFVAVYALSP
jgi:hypothetical protein